MMVLPLEEFEAFGAIPRSLDGLAVACGALPEDAVIVLVSHRWLRPTATPAHPDDEIGSKFAQIKSLVAAATRSGTCGSSAGEDSSRPIFAWIDFASIEQDDGAKLIKGVNSLPLYVQCADIFISLSDHVEYYERAWCRLECLFAKASYETSSLPQLYEPLSEATSEATSEANAKLVAHRVVSDAEIAALVQPGMIREARLSSEDDRHMVCFLSTQAAVL
jgi:hypothetical protein